MQQLQHLLLFVIIGFKLLDIIKQKYILFQPELSSFH